MQSILFSISAGFVFGVAFVLTAAVVAFVLTAAVVTYPVILSIFFSIFAL